MILDGIDIEVEGSASYPVIIGDWQDKKAYRCHVVVLEEEDGSFSTIVVNLPGCGSCGPTLEEALENTFEAVLGVVESHIAAGESIPWKDSSATDIPEGAIQKWILVNA